MLHVSISVMASGQAAGVMYQHGAPLQVDVLHTFLVKIDGLGISVIEAPQPVLDAENLVWGHTIIFECENDVLDDIIESRTQTPTGDHCRCDLHVSLHQREMSLHYNASHMLLYYIGV